MTTATFPTLDQLIADGLTYSVKFVPRSKTPKQENDWKCLSWKVRIEFGRQVLETDYHTGLGLCGKAVQSRIDSLPKCCIDRQQAENELMERGSLKGHRSEQPSLRDVIHSLLLDSEAIDYGTFEEWADNFGYDHDSRKAEQTYRACLTTGLKLRAMFGEAKIQELREEFKDY